MKKLLIISLIMIFGLSLGLLSCGSSSSSGLPEGQGSGNCEFNTDDEIIIGYGPFEKKDPPADKEWVVTRPFLGEHNGEKVAFVYAEADGGDRTQAENAARAYAFGNLAESIKTQVVKQFAEAREAIGVGSDQDIEAVSRSLVATKAKVEVVGATEYDHVTIKMMKIGKVDPETCQELTGRKTFFRTIYAMAIPYNIFIELRDKIVQQADTSDLDGQQKRLLNRTNEHINSEEGRDVEPVVEIPEDTPEPPPMNQTEEDTSSKPGQEQEQPQPQPQVETNPKPVQQPQPQDEQPRRGGGIRRR